MLAAAEVARHAQRLRVLIDDDHRVRAVFMAAPAMILDGLAGSILAWQRHDNFDLSDAPRFALR